VRLRCSSGSCAGWDVRRRARRRGSRCGHGAPPRYRLHYSSGWPNRAAAGHGARGSLCCARAHRRWRPPGERRSGPLRYTLRADAQTCRRAAPHRAHNRVRPPADRGASGSAVAAWPNGRSAAVWAHGLCTYRASDRVRRAHDAATRSRVRTSHLTECVERGSTRPTNTTSP
jgi:hypothetical protein